MLRAREAVRTLKEYRPPLRNRDGLRLDFNENTVGCSPGVLERLRNIDAEMLTRYPQRDKAEVAIASFLGVLPEEVLLTSGTDEAIHLVCETYLESGDDALIVVPTYAMFEIYAAETGARVVAIPSGPAFEFPVEEVLAQITPRTRLFAVANPNNPTGTLASAEDLIRIAQDAPDAAILVDEAYFEFCGETMIQRWRELPNIFVTRTFSKAYGLAALRAGVLMGSADQMSTLRRASSPYNVNALAVECLPAAVADQAYVQKYVAEVIDGRREAEAELDASGIRFCPSNANFVLMQIGDQCSRFVEKMRERGILVRDRSSDPGCRGWVRVTIGATEHNRRLLSAMREILAELGLLSQVAQ